MSGDGFVDAPMSETIVKFDDRLTEKYAQLSIENGFCTKVDRQLLDVRRPYADFEDKAPGCRLEIHTAHDYERKKAHLKAKNYSL